MDYENAMTALAAPDWWESALFRQFLWLGVGSGKAASLVPPTSTPRNHAGHNANRWAGHFLNLWNFDKIRVKVPVFEFWQVTCLAFHECSCKSGNLVVSV